MQLNRCPSCHCRISIEQMAQDKSASDLLALLIDLPEGVGRSLIIYMGLFRSTSRDLANDRALRLANEVLELSNDKNRLAVAMNETVQAMRIKQDEGGFKPLTNHNYLKRVLETVSAVSIPTNPGAGQLPAVGARQSKAAMTVDMLNNYATPDGIDEWFTRTICDALAELLLMGLENVPAYDMMPRVVERFLTELWPRRNWDRKNHFRGADRLHRAFKETAETTKRWPSIKDVLSLIPSQ